MTSGQSSGPLSSRIRPPKFATWPASSEKDLTMPLACGLVTRRRENFTSGWRKSPDGTRRCLRKRLRRADPECPSRGRGAEVPGRSGIRDARPGVEHLFSAAQFLKSPSSGRPRCGRPNRAKSSSLSDARPISAHPKGADALRSHASLPREGRAARVCRPDPGSGRTACRGALEFTSA